ncbi:MAG: DinB family protein [Anaerolineaceae bacterium]|nr:DinB family protein [Anaerolineaceae bacterium]
MQIDFSPITDQGMTYLEFAKRFNRDDLRAVTNTSIDTMLDIIHDLNDGQVTYEPVDPDAHDSFAIEGEEDIGWTIAHLIAHVTASSEEGAALSSLLARGFSTSERPRYETPWRDLTTQAQCVQRLEESRRMRLAYLDTWPDVPQLDVYREISPRFTEKFGEMNAPAAFLFGLKHEVGHYDQFREVRQQALAATNIAAE